MMTDAAAIFFGVEVPEALLAAEMQNHEASSLADARAMAGRAPGRNAVATQWRAKSAASSCEA